MSGSQVFSGGQVKNAGNSYFREVTIHVQVFPDGKQSGGIIFPRRDTELPLSLHPPLVYPLFT